MMNDNDFKDCESINEHDNGNTRWWITTSSCGWFKTVKTKVGEIDSKQNWENHIYFDTYEEAKAFEHELIGFIKSAYPRAQEEGWFDGE